MSLLNVELSRERMRDRERTIQLDLQAVARMRAIRRARREAKVRALWLRRILPAR